MSGVDIDGAIWWLAIGRDKIGPMTRGDVHARFARNEIETATLAWRAGMADWIPLARIRSFADLMPATVIVAPTAAVPSTLTGARNESSVLFSLGALAETTTQRIRPARRIGGASSSVRSEGSGLLDIRTMAETYRADHTPVGARASADPFAAQAPQSFALSPSLMLPAQSPARTDRKLLVTLAGLTGVLAIAALVLAVLVVKGNGDSHAATHRVEPPTNRSGTPNGSQPEPSRVEETPPPSVEAPEGENPIAEQPAAKRPAAKRPAAKRPAAKRPAAKRPAAKRPSSSRPIKRPVKRPTATNSPTRCMDAAACLIMDNPPACCLREHGLQRPKPPAATQPDPNLPKTLSSGAISAGIRRVSTGRCRGQGVGTVVVRLKVTGNGSVASVAVKSAPNAAIGKCVAARVKGASFRKTQNGGSFNYAFPFR